MHSSAEHIDCRLGVIRHAQTEWNACGRIQGQQNSSLTEVGRQDAIRWARLLVAMGWNRILTSDLGRAMETAALIGSILGLPVEPDARLREMDWGVWTGLTMPEIRAYFPMIWEKASSGDWSFSPPQGERYLDVHRRAAAALCDAADRNPHQRILVICHEGTLKCLYYHPACQRPSDASIPPMQSGCLQCFDRDNIGIHLVRPNALVLSDMDRNRNRRNT